MGTKEKLVERFKRQPKDFTFNELTRLFQILGFEMSQKGKHPARGLSLLITKKISLMALINHTLKAR